MQDGNPVFVARSKTKVFLLACVFALGYFSLACVGDSLSAHASAFVTFWLPSGWFVAFLLLTETRLWPFIVLAAFPANLAFDAIHSRAFGVSVLFTCGNCLEPLAGAYLVRRFVAYCPTLNTGRKLIRFVFYSPVLSTLLSAAVGATVVYYFYGDTPYWITFRTWWIGDALGIVVAAPFFLLLAASPRAFLELFSPPKRAFEFLILITLVLLVSWYAFAAQTTWLLFDEYLVVPVLLWAAFRFGTPGAVVANIFLSLMTAWHTSHGAGGLFWHGSTDLGERLISVQFFLATLSFTGLLTAAILDERKSAEASIRGSEARWAKVLENLPVLLEAFDEKGNVLFWNRECERVTGYSPQEMLSNSIALEALYPDKDYRERMLSSIERSGYRFRDWDWELLCKDGSIRTVSWTNISAESPIPGWYTWAVGRDVTDALRVERAVRESEARFRALFTQMLDAFALHEIVLDDAGKPIDYRFIEVNPAFEAMIGMSREHVLGKTVLELMPAIEPYWIETYGRVALTGEPAYFENYTQTLDRHYEIIAFCPQKGQFACIFVDITERKRAEEAIKQSSKRVAETLDSINDGFFSLDENLVVTYFNHAAEELLGKKREEVLGKPLFDSFPEARGSIFEENYRRALKEKIFLSFEVNFNVPPYANWYDVRIYPQTECISVYFQVVSERKNLELQLRQSQKMEAIGNLAGGIAHDFNNILHVILAHGRFAVDGLPLDDQRRKDLEMILQAAKRAAELTNHLLAFSRRQVLQPVKIMMNILIQDLINLLRRIIGENIELTTSLDGDLLPVLGDRGQIEQVLTNLIVNARDAMPDGGHITIETKNRLLTAWDSASREGTNPGWHVQVSLEDNGSGMDPATLEHIFEPFFTTKEEGKGTGLGLSTVYGIVRQHSGLIDVRSEPVKGTRFEILLPSTDVDSQQQAKTPDSQPTTGTETILVAEDDDSVRRVIKRTLESAKYTAIMASDGLEALKIFQEKGDQIHLVVSDVVMPKMGGMALYEKIRKINPDVRFLFSSGYTSNPALSNKLSEEGVDLIRKPYEPNQLLQRVRKILDAG